MGRGGYNTGSTSQMLITDAGGWARGSLFPLPLRMFENFHYETSFKESKNVGLATEKRYICSAKQTRMFRTALFINVPFGNDPNVQQNAGYLYNGMNNMGDSHRHVKDQT